jgi:hypothetical protein
LGKRWPKEKVLAYGGTGCVFLDFLRYSESTSSAGADIVDMGGTRNGDRKLIDILTDDTPFRLYRESNIYREDKATTWISIAGTIDEIRVVAAQL